MFHKPIKLLDVELNGPIRAIESLDDYDRLQALVRLHGTPIGYVNVPVTNGCCTGRTIGKAIFEQHAKAIVHHLLCDSLAVGRGSREWSIEDLLEVPHPVYTGVLPKVTVAVCSRDRTVDLARCLDSLKHLDYPDLDLLVVDNAPSNGATERLLRDSYPNIRYVREPRPGLNWARNRAILESKGEIIAFTDDDVVVDPNWVKAIAMIFGKDSSVMAVTGLVVPYELETEAQVLFERDGGFGRGFERRWFHASHGKGKGVAKLYGGTGRLGTGANMAYRRNLFERIDYFDPALDVGTPTEGGGDLEMFFRVIKEGYTLVYEPSAVVRHVHRVDRDRLRDQFSGWGAGFYSYVVRSCLSYPEECIAFLRLGLSWMWQRDIRRLLISYVGSSRSERDLIEAELKGTLTSVFRYVKARSQVAETRKKFGPLLDPQHHMEKKSREFKNSWNIEGVAVKLVDLREPLKSLFDVSDYLKTRVFVELNGRLAGEVEIANAYQPISANRLGEEICRGLATKLLQRDEASQPGVGGGRIIEDLSRHFLSGDEGMEVAVRDRLPSDVSASVVIATYDRPDGLRKCLRCLMAQESPRKVEIIVVDNDPDSKLTPPVVADFPGVILVKESRRGLAYARNAGFIASQGEVVVCTDDDVLTPPDWLEKLIAPFGRTEVMIVTGNVLPLELETRAQQLFETYGGLGRGFDRLEVDRNWFDSFGRRAVPTWRLGATANAAFRACIFSDPHIGLMDEALGPGTASGVGEDTYLFYKVLKAGHTIIYEPSAYVWHKHRSELKAFRHQIYSYSKGHVAYHLTTLVNDHDLRAILRLVIELPRWHLWRIKEWLLGRRTYPLSLVAIEILGHLMGPWALWQSRRRVRREGRSTACFSGTSLLPPETSLDCRKSISSSL